MRTFVISFVFFGLVLCLGAQSTPKHLAAPKDAGALLNQGSDSQFMYLKTDTGILVPFVALAPEKTKSPVRVIIFLHQGNSNYSIFTSSAKEANKLGILSIMLEVGALIPDEKTINWGQALYGLETVLAWLDSSTAIQKDRISLVGSSMGANCALVFFGENPKLRSVFALSPAINYDNVRPTAGLRKLEGRTAVIVASEDDPLSYTALTTWKKSIAGPDYVGYKSGGHGVSMFAGNDLRARYTTWLKTLD